MSLHTSQHAAPRASSNGAAIPAFAPAGRGDDVEAARRFIERTVAAMRTLDAGDRTAVLRWLDAVETGARALNARAIARVAGEAHRIADEQDRVQAIHTLGALVAQYEQGLVDVEVQIERDARGHSPDMHLARQRPAEPTSPDLFYGEADPDHARDRWEEARQTLQALLPSNDSTSHAQALTKLVAFDPRNGGKDTDTGADVVPIGPRTGVSAAFDVEPLLPGLMDHAHRLAAAQGKRLTASYAARDARLSPALADVWQGAMETLIQSLVDVTLELPETRKARGESAAAHMALTVEGRTTQASEEVLEVLVRCPGAIAPNVQVDAPHTLDIRLEEGWVNAVFTVHIFVDNPA